MGSRNSRIINSIFAFFVIVLLCEKCEGPSTPTSPLNNNNGTISTQKKKENKSKSSKNKKRPESKSIDQPIKVEKPSLPEIAKQVILAPVTVIVEGFSGEDLNVLIDEADHSKILVDWDGVKEKFSSIINTQSMDILDSKTQLDKENGYTWISFESIFSIGLTAKFDESKQEILISFPHDLKESKTINLMSDVRAGKPENPIPIAPISGYMNLFGNKTYLNGERYEYSEHPSFSSFYSDAVLNLYGWALEGHVKKMGGEKLTADQVKLTKDDTERGVRYSFGDVLVPRGGFLQVPTIGGVSVQRVFAITPHRVLLPINENEVILKTRAHLEIVVNKRVIFSQLLESGTYDVRNFPFTVGVNDVTFIVRDITTKQILDKYELARFSYSRNILRKGLHEFHYVAGSNQTPLSDKDSLRFLDNNYSKENYTLALAHRYGLLDRLTVATYAQLENFYSMNALGLTIGSPFGVLTLEGAHSRNSNLNLSGYAARLEHLFQFSQLNLRFGLERRYPGFTVGSFSDGTDGVEQGYYASLGAPITNYVQGYVQYNNWTYRNNTSKWESSLGLSGRLARSLTVSAVGTYEKSSQDQNPNASAKLNLTYSFGSLGARASTDTKNQSDALTAGYTKIIGTGTGISGGGGITRSPGQNVYSQSGRLFTPKGDISIVNSVAQTELNSGSATTISGSTGFSFIGTNFAWSGITGDSFIMVKGEGELRNEKLMINPSNDYTRAQAETDIFGPAITKVGSYNQNRIIVGLPDQKPGLTLTQDNFLVAPSYKSGTLIRIKAEKTITISGILIGTDEKPLAEVSGEMRVAESDSKDEPIFFYTNKKGEFLIEGVKAKKYILEFFTLTERKMKIAVPKSETGEANLGRLHAPFNK